MPITRWPSAAEFLAATTDSRAADPLLTNVIGSVATGVVAGRRYASELWLTVHAADGAVVGMAIRTAPWNLTISAMPADAAAELGEYVARVDPNVPGVAGPQEAVATTIDAMGLPADRKPRVRMVDVVRVLTAPLPPAPTPGTARLAGLDDRALLVDWFQQFGQDAGVVIHDVDASVGSAIDDGRMWLWEADGVPVAMAGFASPVESPGGTVVRIGPVFTPPVARRRGFAAAVTAALAADLAGRHDTVMLFADAARPDTNRLYERLGFHEVDRIVEVSLDGTAPS